MRKVHWMRLGQAAALCAVLMFVIAEERRPLLMVMNFGAFFGVFLVASTFAVAVALFLQRGAGMFSERSVGSLAATSFLFGHLALLGLGGFFLDLSTPRPIPWGNTYRYQYQPPQGDNDWPSAALADVGLEPALFRHLVEEVVNYDDYRGIHSVLVAKDGRLVFEEYFYDQTADLPHPLRSANKSLTSALVGIALDEGLIGSVDDSVYDYFPELRGRPDWDPAKDGIKLRHLLAMTGGLDAHDWDPRSPGGEEHIYRLQQDWSVYYLTQPLKHEPGTVYAYSTGGEMVLRDLITRVSGLSLQDFTQTRLFEPLGITNVVWHTFAYGRIDLPVRVDMTPRDMLKFGQLYLNQGVWRGRRVLSAEWITLSTATHSQVPHAGLGFPEYGFLWWKHGFQIGGRRVPSFAAQGNGGQIILVLPEQATVVVFTQGNYNKWRQANPFRLTRELILPSFGGCRSIAPLAGASGDGESTVPVQP